MNRWANEGYKTAFKPVSVRAIVWVKALW